MINERKELFVVDRIKELIKVRGLQVAPSELEGHLLSHPDVADVCVVSIPDEFSGELPFAFVVLKDSARLRVEGQSGALDLVKEALMQVRRDTLVWWVRYNNDYSGCGEA